MVRERGAAFSRMVGLGAALLSMAAACAPSPPEVRLAEGVGLVTIECAVGENGSLRRCAVIRESPQGFGYGEATLRLARTQMGPVARAGQGVEGARVRMTIRWTSSDDGTVTPETDLDLPPPEA
ncbi:hypothetical protein [Brevundimonas sp.]|uniref:hypothetical protein n=1 Tax=Brevundimonas sp. TaxID=1871086 RepID=UPI001D6C40A1|nr:hypothetical protein [Brevundimonas sp.]MBA4000271.1 hypothetical protein [Brevundimonas sp.]